VRFDAGRIQIWVFTASAASKAHRRFLALPGRTAAGRAVVDLEPFSSAEAKVNQIHFVLCFRHCLCPGGGMANAQD
jgi:hypothetical protein